MSTFIAEELDIAIDVVDAAMSFYVGLGIVEVSAWCNGDMFRITDKGIALVKQAILEYAL